jgi:hypothetical protein
VCLRTVRFPGGLLGDLAGALRADLGPHGIGSHSGHCVTRAPYLRLRKSALECRLDLVTEGEAKMRVFSIALIALISLAQAQAQEPTESKKPSYPCSYTIHGYSYEVPSGTNLCWRDPYPYTTEYALLRCDPPLQEITSVKRGDPRCGGHYEERQ